MKPLTLYHSTTELYLSSILKEGLGKIDPNETFGILDFLRHLYSLCLLHMKDDQNFKEIEFTTSGMVNQIRKNGFNFIHNKTYLSFLEEIAIRYSLNRCSSELLSRALILYEMLKKNGYQEHIDKSLTSIDFEKLSMNKYQKILLKVKDINPYYLETEMGGNAIDAIVEMNKIKEIDFHVYKIQLQKFNFALNTVISPQDIKIFRIKIKGLKGINVEYELENYIGQQVV